jgi:hypothetical protein
MKAFSVGLPTKMVPRFAKVHLRTHVYSVGTEPGKEVASMNLGLEGVFYIRHGGSVPSYGTGTPGSVTSLYT